MSTKTMYKYVFRDKEQEAGFEIMTGKQLLEQILWERHEKWVQAELAKIKALGKEIKNDKWKDKYKGPASIEEGVLPEIPDSWIWTSAEAVCDSVRDGTHDTPQYVTEGIPLITSKNLIANKLDFDKTKLISFDDHKEISKRSAVNTGDILFAMIGTVGNPVVVKSHREFSIKNVGLFKENHKYLISEYLKYWLDSPVFIKWLEPKLKGTTQKFAPLGLLRGLPVPLSSHNNQNNIVSEIEKQFSRLDEAVAALKRIKANLKRYKASVLKAAVEGKLTEEWRKEHPDVEPASALLKRILAERRRKWEETNSKNKYKEPIAPDFTKLPCLPASWTGITLSTVINKVKRGPSMKCNRDGMGVRYITSGNLNNGKLRLDLDQKYLDNFTNIEKCELKPGDLILNCVNSLEQIGKSAVFHKQHGKAIVGFNNYALELNTDFISAEYANIFCESEIFKRQIYFLIKRAVNQVSFATRELDFICVPLPSANEQREMVLEVERLLSVTEEVDQELDLNLIRAERLRQSILKQAFSGKLVLRVIEAVT